MTLISKQKATAEQFLASPELIDRTIKVVDAGDIARGVRNRNEPPEIIEGVGHDAYRCRN